LIVGKDESRTIFERGNLPQQHIIINGDALLFPFLATRFENPETHHVLEKTDRPERSTFVGEVMSRHFFVYQDLFALNPNQGPGAG
jgi:hypothetical protein